ncbi:hypothetical protein WDU94_015461 [Cyamophila willieti]
MCTEVVDVCIKTEIDLYDDAILGNGPGSEEVDMKYSPMIVSESNQVEEYDRRSSRYESLNQHSHDYKNNLNRTKTIETTSCNSEENFLYVGNLTWWTSDLELSNAIRDIGVSDILDIKFFENASNGQSKGFCKVTLGSERSVRKVKERLPDMKLHGRRPDVEYPTRNVLYKFESQNPLRARSKRFSSNSQVAW